MKKDEHSGDGMNPLHFHCRGSASAFGNHMKALENFFINVHDQLADALLIEEDEKKNTQDELLDFDDLRQRSRSPPPRPSRQPPPPPPPPSRQAARKPFKPKAFERPSSPPP